MRSVSCAPVHREPLLRLLDRYLERWPSDRAVVERFRAFVRSRPDCFERTCPPGHITASAWILSAEGDRFLLTHHRKLDRWLQLGGHADGDPDPARVALREAREESGMERFAFADESELAPIPLDLDVHAIPAHGGDPAHLHYDVRYLLVAAPGQALRKSDESHEVRWFPVARAADVLTEESTLRLARRARALRASR